MKTVGDLVRGREVFFVESDSTVLETVSHLVDKKIGAVPVLENGRLAGIFSERDLMTRVIVKGRDPEKVRVGDVMTRDVVVARVDESVEACEKRMSKARIRHVPVVEGDRMVGFISVRDLLEVEISEKSEEIEYLTSYIHFTPPAPDEGGGA